MKPGQLLKCQTTSQMHFGIYAGDGKVIRVNELEDGKKAVVESEPLSGRGWESTEWTPAGLARFPPSVVAGRAWRSLAEASVLPYYSASANSESFAAWCRHGLVLPAHRAGALQAPAEGGPGVGAAVGGALGLLSGPVGLLAGAVLGAAAESLAQRSLATTRPSALASEASAAVAQGHPAHQTYAAALQGHFAN